MHLRIDIDSDQFEDDGLSSDHGLVVAFEIGDSSFVLSSVDQFVPEPIEIPVLVRDIC